MNTDNRSNSSNAELARAAANAAANSSNGYAKTIGKGVQIADKLSDGKASEKIGKTMSKVNRASGLPGRAAQALANKSSQSGTSDRIAKAASKRQNAGLGAGAASASGSKKANLSSNSENFSNPSYKDTEEKSSDGGGLNFKTSYKLVKWVLILSAPVMGLIILICLLMSASNVYLNSVGLGAADSVSQEDAEDKINKKLEDENPTDDISFDNYIYESDYARLSKERLKSSNLELTATKYLKRKYSQVDLDNLEDFFPSIKSVSKNYDENLVYDFYYKMYNLYTKYKKDYNVSLDMPLIMAVLKIQTEDYYDVFVSNLTTEDRKATKRKNYDDMDYYYNWDDYSSTKTNSEHDMEIVAQHMVVEKDSSECDSPVNGKCYVVDNDQFREFLKEFIEKKYYIEEGYSTKDSSSSISGGSCRTESTPFHKFNLTEDQLVKIASLCVHEQGSPEGAAAEASLMANKFDLNNGGNEVEDSGTKLYNYVRNIGWWFNAAKNMDAKSASTEALEAVRDVLVNGYRTLPGYIDEHDYKGDIASVTTNGVSKEIKNNSSYEKHNTVIKNKMGSTYTFYIFPTETSDPFGYTSQANREKIGETYFEYGSNNSVTSCGESSSENNETSQSGSWQTWQQCSEPWGSMKVPTSPKTVCKIGCLLTSVTIQIARSGVETTVDDLNPGTALNKYKFSCSGGKNPDGTPDCGNFDTSSTRYLAPNFVYKTTLELRGMSKSAVAEKLGSYNPDKYYIILGVSRDKNYVQHFVALEKFDTSTGDLYMIDPGTNHGETNPYKLYKIRTALIYEKKS